MNYFELPAERCPEHVAIIMDGNGRWARERGFPRIEGHRRGVKSVKRIMNAVQNTNVKIVTLYAFSVENWNRPESEVGALMNLLDYFLNDQLAEMIKRRIRFKVVGRYNELPKYIQDHLQRVEAATAQFDEQTLALALNYGARTEVVDTVKKITQAVQRGEIDIENLDYGLFSRYLYTGDLPDPDLIIRTSGEHRLSNFLLLQGAYAEIYFTPVHWPDFGEEDFYSALANYAARERRYGKTTEQLQKS